MKTKLNTRYVVELVVTLILILVITVVLVRFFVLSRSQSMYARELTHAVNIAQNVAEIASASKDHDDFIGILEGSSQIDSLEEQNEKTTFSYSFVTDEKGSVSEYNVEVLLTGDGSLQSVHIDVFGDNADKAIYSLDTKTYSKEAVR